jgi:hypothetical protein
MKTLYARRNLIFLTSLILSACAVAKVSNSESFAEVKVAVLGDTGAGDGFASVLSLAAAEGAHVVMINGDLGYGSSPATWNSKLRSSIDTNSIAIIGSLGNHDVEQNNTQAYINVFEGLRNSQNSLKTKCSGNTVLAEGQDIAAVDEVCTFGNVSLIANGIGQVLNKKYLEDRLEIQLKRAPTNNWKLVGYHFTLDSMNPGIKTSNENTHRFFDLIRQHGAIGAQAHTHSAMASCPISSTFSPGTPVHCHENFQNLEQRFILPGTGLFVDSSLSGREARNRRSCHRGTEVGCAHMVDLITSEGYTRTDGARRENFNRLGAIFMVFNAGGDPAKALVYFKSTDGQEIFRFQITKDL